MFDGQDGQELSEQNSDYFDQPPYDEEEVLRPIESNKESYLVSIRKSQVVVAAPLEDVDDENFIGEKLPGRSATIVHTDAGGTIKPFTRVNKLQVDRCKSPNFMKP